MKTLSSLNLSACCIHRKFVSRPDLFERFFEMNDYVDISTEPLEELTDRYNINKKTLNNSKIYCSSAEATSKNIFTFPLFWMYKRPLVDFDIEKCFLKKFVTLNGAYSTSRIDFISKLKAFGLLDQGYYSLWNSNNTAIPLPSETDENTHYNIKYTLPVEWFNSLYEFEIETSSKSGVPYLFISEKTFRPLLSGKPFLNYGYPGMYKRLKEYGFEFDSNLQFDEDIENRFKLYVDEVIRLINIKPNVKIVKKNKIIAREIYNDNKKEFKKFKLRLNALSNMIYIDDEMEDYLNV